MDTIGNNVILTLTGASHGKSVGCELCGLPAGIKLDMEAIRFELARRSAANCPFATPRHEPDEPLILSGIREGATDGEPVIVEFANHAHDRSEYSCVARPSHADYCAYIRSEGKEDISGGGKYSGRMTLPLTFAGAVCRQILKGRGIEVFSHVLAIGEVQDERFDPMMEKAPETDPFFPLVDPNRRAAMEKLLLDTRAAGDTLSCEAEVAALGLPVGLGEPLFDGIEGAVSKYLFMIPGLRGVEFGERRPFGSGMNDQFTEGGRTLTNRSNGVNGGMANGMPLIFRAWFRPVPSISKPQTGFDLNEKKPVPLTISGRHDTCILPRGLAAVEAAACIALLDLLMEYDKRDGSFCHREGLGALRRELDSIDGRIMRLYKERMEVSKRIGAYKRENGMEIFDPGREQEVIESRAALLPKELRRGGEGLMRSLIEASKSVQRGEFNIYLTGMPDCGKTRMGKKLAALLEMPLADTDRIIMEREGRSVDAIFREDGEEYFRCAETELIRLIAARGGLIVATGGGLPMRPENARMMKTSGFTVFLDRKLSALHDQNTRNRPLLAAATAEEVNANVDRLYRERRERYLACADLVIDPDEEGAAERIAEAYRKLIAY